MIRMAVVVSLLGVAGCANEPVTMELNFPSKETFLQSEFARVRVFDLREDELGICPSLVGQAISGAGGHVAALDSQNVAVCDARNGGIRFDEVSEGPKAFVATASRSNQVILAGCTIAEVYADAPVVVIRLAPTARYATVVTEAPECRSIEDKCDRGCR